MKSDFGRILKNLRKINWFTQRELAQNLGVSQNLIFQWENCKSEPSLEMLNRLADLFGVTADFLLGREGSPIIEADYIKLPKEKATEFWELLGKHLDKPK